MNARWLAAVWLASSAALAHPPRYAVCHEERKAAPVRPEPEQRAREADDWMPLARRRPPRLERAKLEVFDVAEVDPMPSRRTARPKPTPRPEEPAVVALESRNTFYCIGVPRGTPGILRTIGAAPGTRFYGHPHTESWRQENMLAAGYLAIAKAVPLLHRELDRPLPKEAEPWQHGERRRTKHAAARALADLGDVASAPRVLALLRSLERDGWNLWRDTLDSLPRLDPALAQKYALELIARGLDEPKLHSQNVTLYSDLLPLLVTPTPETLALLRRASAKVDKDSVALAHGSGGCAVLATRLRLGDAELARELRAELNTASLVTQRSVECYSTLMPALYPGQDASELDVWMHRHRYDEMLTWLEATRSAPADPAKKRLLAWLTKRSKEPDVAGDRSRNDYQPEKRAKHLAALAALGDTAAKAQLDAWVADEKDDGTAPWVAAYYMLRLELPGAADLAVKRLQMARQQHMRRYSRDAWPRFGAHVVTEHGRIVQELAARGDERWVLGLLDREGFTRELSVYLLAKTQPKGACGIVGDAARLATDEAVDQAFWALSLLGDRCRDTMQKLVADATQPPHVRGMANEHLAMLRDGSVPRNLTTDRRFHASRERARIIYHAPE
ncbi:MAG: hypothetical protein IPM35_23050 [Myxococcales bacterium]|nr:hypothetical protein [Myxococcales bacterium]